MVAISAVWLLLNLRDVRGLVSQLPRPRGRWTSVSLLCESQRRLATCQGVGCGRGWLGGVGGGAGSGTNNASML